MKLIYVTLKTNAEEDIMEELTAGYYLLNLTKKQRLEKNYGKFGEFSIVEDWTKAKETIKSWSEKDEYMWFSEDGDIIKLPLQVPYHPWTHGDCYEWWCRNSTVWNLYDYEDDYGHFPYNSHYDYFESFKVYAHKWDELRKQRARAYGMCHFEDAIVGDTTYLKSGQSYYDLDSQSMTTVRDNINKKATLCVYEGVEYWVSCNECPYRGMYRPCKGCGRSG